MFPTFGNSIQLFWKPCPLFGFCIQFFWKLLPSFGNHFHLLETVSIWIGYSIQIMESVSVSIGYSVQIVESVSVSIGYSIQIMDTFPCIQNGLMCDQITLCMVVYYCVYKHVFWLMEFLLAKNFPPNQIGKVVMQCVAKKKKNRRSRRMKAGIWISVFGYRRNERVKYFWYPWFIFLFLRLQNYDTEDMEDLDELKENISDMLDDAWNLPPANRKKVRRCSWVHVENRTQKSG